MELLVAADDRTGALEAAGALVDGGCGPVPVVAHGHAAALPPAAVVVVDLGTRHLRGDEVIARCEAADALAARRHAHKIDSTLRGGWAAELVARSVGRRVLVVPALPALGRTCVGGVVCLDGHPVHETASGRDVSGVLDTSRPSELLRRAGVGEVAELAGAAACEAWLAGDGPAVAVCDASSDDDLDGIGRLWAARGAPVLLAGTSAAIAAGARHLPFSGRRPGPAPELLAPAVVVRGSTHPASVAQVDRLVAAGAVEVRPDDVAAARRASADGRVVVIAASAPNAEVTPDGAARVAASLASATRTIVDVGAVATVVLLGGDTAAAILDCSVLTVEGTLAPGTPWGRVEPDGPLYVTRSGGFGGPDALVDLPWATLAP